VRDWVSESDCVCVCVYVCVPWWRLLLSSQPQGATRSIPHKLKLVFAINHALSLHYLYLQDVNVENLVLQIRGFETDFGHLASLVWNSGLEWFSNSNTHELDGGICGYGKTTGDPISLRPVPFKINHVHALSTSHSSQGRFPSLSSSTSAVLSVSVSSLSLFFFPSPPSLLLLLSFSVWVALHYDTHKHMKHAHTHYFPMNSAFELTHTRYCARACMRVRKHIHTHT